ncbi:hypothetical protein CsSME_00012288 [Camellia sinensis var. sinensis]
MLSRHHEQGSQVLAVNCYPACPESDLALGMPPHSDYGTLTILTQTHQGLQIMDHDKNWLVVTVIEGGLIKRFSIASLHSLSLEKMVAPAPKPVDEEHQSGYRGGNSCGFLDYISGNDIMKLGRYIDTLKKKTSVACPLGELDNRLRPHI